MRVASISPGINTRPPPSITVRCSPPAAGLTCGEIVAMVLPVTSAFVGSLS
jgi:hypothetical protein